MIVDPSHDAGNTRDDDETASRLALPHNPLDSRQYLKDVQMKSIRGFLMLPLAAAALVSANAMAQSAAAAAGADSQASNPFSPAAGHPYRHGVIPTREVHAKMQGWEKTNKSAAALATPAAAAAATGPQTLSYGGGGVISGTPKVYLVVMGTQWGSSGSDGSGNLTVSNDPVGAVPYLQKLFKGLGTGGELWSGTMTQYCDAGATAGATSCPASAAHIGYPTGGAFAGVWYDNSNSAPSAATGTQLAQEAVHAAAHFGNTSAASNRYVQYVILSPTGTHPDGFNTSSGGFCAWHSSTGSSYGNIAYTNMPYVADMGGSCGQGMVNGNSAQGKLDGFSIVNGHEYAETVTDTYPNSGWTNTTGSSSNGQENGDECAWISSGAQAATQNVSMGNGTFAMQSTWSNDTNACNISHPIVGSTGSSDGQWAFCANENGSCIFTGTQTVRYGAGSTFVTKSLAWNATCNNTTFGDPLPGVAKHCEVTSTWTFCANENAQCGFSGTETIRYGAGSSYFTNVFTGGAACNNGTFGDPISGTAKHCDTAATTWTFCTDENGQCAFSGTKAVLYGANGNYWVKTLTGGAACNNTTFGGDPAPGIGKHCYLPGL